MHTLLQLFKQHAIEHGKQVNISLFKKPVTATTQHVITESDIMH